MTQILYDHLDKIEILPWQTPIIEIGKAKLLSLTGQLFKSNLLFKNIFQMMSNSDPLQSKSQENEIHAFYYYEQCLLANKMNDLDRYSFCIQVGSRLTNIRNFKLAYELHLETQKLKNSASDFSVPEKILLNLENSGVYALASAGWRTIGIIAKTYKDFSRANSYYENSLTIARRHNLTQLVNQIYLAMAVLKFECGNYHEAIEQLNLINPIDNHDQILCSKFEVLALIEEKSGNIRKSIQLVQKALDISLELDHVVMVPDEAHYLGQCFENHLNDPDQAEHYYRIGYEHSIRYAEHGIPLNGERKKVVDAYLNVLRSRKHSEGKSKHKKSPFSFSEGKSWRYIIDTFQHQLILHHGKNIPNSRALANKLVMPPTTLYSLQTRLRERGYLIPERNTNHEVSTHELHDFFIQHEELSWQEINTIFEREIIHYLYEKYGYNKQRMANILELSYPALINKTRELTQLNALFLPN